MDGEEDTRTCNKCGKAFVAAAKYIEGSCVKCRKQLREKIAQHATEKPRCPRCSKPTQLNEHVVEVCGYCNWYSPLG